MPTLPAVFAKILQEKIDRERDARPMRNVGRNPDGSARLQRIDGECVGRGASDSYSGQIVTHLEPLGFGNAGASGVSLNDRRGSQALLWMEAQDPHDTPAGAVTTVSIAGYGFTEDTGLDYLLPGTDQVHPDIVQVDQRLISSTEIELDLEVGVDAELFAQAPIAYGPERLPPLGLNTQYSRRRENFYGISEGVVVNQYAFGTDIASSSLRALLYADGTFSSERGAEASLAEAVVVGCILEDASELVGVGSPLALLGGELHVWDVAGEVVHSYAPAAGWELRGGHVYHGGFLYWVETAEILDVSPEGAPPYTGTESFELRLLKAATDFSDPEVVDTIDVVAVDFGIPWTHFLDPASNPATTMVDADGAVVYFSARLFDPNHENVAWTNQQFRIPLGGGAPATRTSGTGVESPLANGDATADFIPTATKGSSFLIAIAADGAITLAAKLDDATNAATALWAEIANQFALSMNVGPDGATAQVYALTEPDYAIYRGAGTGSLIVDEVDGFDGEKRPEAMFYFGGA